MEKRKRCVWHAKEKRFLRGCTMIQHYNLRTDGQLRYIWHAVERIFQPSGNTIRQHKPIQE